uniref:Uncharacterized protein n=1 Tax=Davidia involucrata TaxID=16924 RepID=A0A5B6ZQ14_DAVIN
MKALINTKMAEETPVRELVLKMIDFLNVLEVLGADIDGELQVDIILESLPDSFNQFKLNYNMNKMNLTLAKLLSSLQAAEGIIKSHPSAHVAEGSSSKPNPKGKGKEKKKKNPKNSKENVGPKGGVGKGKKGAGSKPKGKCFHCRCLVYMDFLYFTKLVCNFNYIVELIDLKKKTPLNSTKAETRRNKVT